LTLLKVSCLEYFVRSEKQSTTTNNNILAELTQSEEIFFELRAGSLFFSVLRLCKRMINLDVTFCSTQVLLGP